MGRTKKRNTVTSSHGNVMDTKQQQPQQQQQQQQQNTKAQRRKNKNPRNHETSDSESTPFKSRGKIILIIISILILILALVCHFIFNSDSLAPNELTPPNRESEKQDLRDKLDGNNNDMYIPAHLDVSYFSQFAVDIRALMGEREEKMKLYEYNYSRNGVDRRSQLSLQEFRDVYDGKWPVILTDVVPTWSAFNWSREFFYENYGKERVTMKAVDNSLDQAVSLALPLELFYKNTHKAFPNRWTYVEDELFIATHPQLKKDIGHCDHLEEDYYQLFPEEVRPWNAMLLWGTQFSRSSLHIDPYNWTGTNAVIKGLKHWKLFPPGQDHLMYVMEGRKSGFPLNCYKYNSPVDSYDVDISTYPAFTATHAIELDQLPGELLIIPTGWFHQAFNMEETIAISSQVMNRNNQRIVLEEIIKAGNVRRKDLPHNIDLLPLTEQVKAVMSLLPADILEHGRHVTADALYQIHHGYKDKQYEMPLQ